MTQTSKNILSIVFILSVVIEPTYTLGYTFGVYYRQYLHSYVKEAFAFTVNRFIDFALLSGEGLRYVVTNRNDIFAKANDIRNDIGRAFSYVY